MKNLEQIRAKNAYDAVEYIGTGSGGGKAVAKKVPAQIVQNGFLGALAFAIESVNADKFVRNGPGWFHNTKPPKDEGEYAGCGYANTFVAIIRHFENAGLSHGLPCGDLQSFLSALCLKDADVLRSITAEALAYLNYLRRFAKPGKDELPAESEV